MLPMPVLGHVDCLCTSPSTACAASVYALCLCCRASVRAVRCPPPLTEPPAADVCARRRTSRRWLYVSDYQPPLSRWVHQLKQLKFSCVTSLRVMLARLLLLSWLNARRTRGLARPALLLCLPLHKRHACRRSCNQGALLARWLSCIAVATCAATSRLEIAMRGRYIALIDDVTTTGHTVEEISRILLAQGAASVQI